MNTLEQEVSQLLHTVFGSDRSVCWCEPGVLPRAGRHRCGGLETKVKALEAQVKALQERLDEIAPRPERFEEDDEL